MYNMPKSHLGYYANIWCSARCISKPIWGLTQKNVPLKFEKILIYYEDQHVSRWLDGWTNGQMGGQGNGLVVQYIDRQRYEYNFYSSHFVVQGTKNLNYFDKIAYIILPMWFKSTKPFDTNKIDFMVNMSPVDIKCWDNMISIDPQWINWDYGYINNTVDTKLMWGYTLHIQNALAM